MSQPKNNSEDFNTKTNILNSTLKNVKMPEDNPQQNLEGTTSSKFKLKNNEIKNISIIKKELIGDVSELSAQREQSNNVIMVPEKLEGAEMTDSARTRIFVFFLLANLFLNYDTGVIPASLLEIIKEIHLDFKEQALIGSLVYLGLSFASLFVSLFFNRYGPAKVCSCVLILNTFCCFVFSISKMKYVLFASRFLMGVSEAFIVIYGPVWVNNYSPSQHSAKWMGILHSCTALGVIVGYLCASIVINFLHGILTWRAAIQFQGIIQIPIALYFYLEKEELINVEMSGHEAWEERTDTIESDINRPRSPTKTRTESHNFESKIGLKFKPQNTIGGTTKSLADLSAERSLRRQKTYISRNPAKDGRIDTIETSNLGRYCNQAKVVITNALYITTTLGLCSMYFIVTGIQFWMTSYLIDILEYNQITVAIVFSTVSITAPLAGVIIGGTFADQYGGYKGKNTLKALKLCSAFGVVAFVFAFPIGFLYSLIYITVLLWTFLFFGAAIVPVGTGIMVSSVRK